MMVRRVSAALLAACWLCVTAPAHAGTAVAAQAQHAASGASAAASAPAPIPFKRDAAVADAALPGGAVGVLLVSLLAIAAVYVLRKRLNLAPATAQGRLLKVLETQRLGPRTLLSVVEFSGKRYLIAQNEHGVSRLASAPVPHGEPQP